MTDTPDETEALSDWERRKLHMYKQAAKDATREVLESFGLSGDEIEEVQRDMAFIRRLRVASEAAGIKTATSIVALIFAAVGSILTIGIQTLLDGK